MTPQEKELLERFLADMVAARAGQKDPQAEALMRDAVSRQPDAVYLLVQRALQLDQALQLTQAEVQKLQGELAQARPAPGGSFLNDPYAWGSKPAAAAPVANPVQQQPAAQPAPAPARPLSGWGGGGMLGTVAGAAAGVVAGSFLYQGIQHLMHKDDPPAAGASGAHPAAQPLVSDGSGFDNLVPDDSELLAGGGDDGGDTV
jgi:uncharacterized protein